MIKIFLSYRTETCKALNVTPTITQTDLLQELTKDCRYDKLQRPPGEISRNDPVKVSCRAYIYTIKSNMAKTLVIKYNFFL